MARYFGTDGFRGKANVGLNAEHAYKIGRFLGWYFTELHKTDPSHHTRIVLGKDTRKSSYMFEYNLVGGIIASGADAYIMHVTTTPSVAYITRTDDFDCGIMISASHNPYYDNGIKLLNHKGEKAEDDLIALVEDYIDGRLNVFGREWKEIPFAEGADVGIAVDYVSGRNRYIGYLISLGMYSFRDCKVALDCANGSSWYIAPMVFEALGAKVLTINDKPDGTNINKDAGSTHIEHLQRFVVENKCDIGFAYDGDADRCLCVDEQGNVIDGDLVIYICGKYLKSKGKLLNDTVVGTVMTNLGVIKAFEREGIKCATTNVGDKYVYEYMNQNNCSIGGEQSGHIIFLEHATTGDGILTSLKIMEVCLATKSSLSKLASEVNVYPQTLKNVKVKDKFAVLEDDDVIAEIKKVENELGDKGRVLIRPSGTEPLIRILIEASLKGICDIMAERIYEKIEEKGYLI